jgi:hypothetical protein
MHAMLVVLQLASVAAAQDVPDGVRYVRASPEANEAASKLLEAAFSSHPPRVARLGTPDPSQTLYVGPFISSAMLQTGVDASRLHSGTYTIPLSPEVQPIMKGLGAQDSPQREEFDKALGRTLSEEGSARIRKLTAKELALIWFYISWDITEPIFVVERRGRSFIADFTDDARSLYWFEEITAPCFRVTWEGGGLKPCYCSVVTQDGNKYHVAFEPKENVDSCGIAHRPD